VPITVGNPAANQLKGPGLQGLFFGVSLMKNPGIEKRGSTVDDNPLLAIK
jgi:hypothetical protein